MKKTLITLMTLSSVTPAFAQEIKLYLECQGLPKGDVTVCQGFPESADDEKSMIYKSKRDFAMHPVLTFNSDNVLSASELDEEPLFAGGIRQQGLRLQLDDAATKKLAEITQQNIDKKIGLVYKNRLLMAPVLQSAITEGSLQIMYGNAVDNGLTEVPWLKEKMNNGESQAARKKTISFVLYLLTAFIALGAATVYGFTKGKKKPDEDEVVAV